MPPKKYSTNKKTATGKKKKGKKADKGKEAAKEPKLPQCQSPQLFPPAGTFEDEVTIKIDCPSCTLHYTTDGTLPTEELTGETHVSWLPIHYAPSHDIVTAISGDAPVIPLPACNLIQTRQ
jgi:hypothetical protein